MIPALWRFPLRVNQEVFRYSRKISGRYVDVFLFPIETLVAQASIVVGKNVSLKAIVRNRVKRRLGEILRQYVLPESKNNMIVRGKSLAQFATYEQLKQEIQSLVAKQ